MSQRIYWYFHTSNILLARCACNWRTHYPWWTWCIHRSCPKFPWYLSYNNRVGEDFGRPSWFCGREEMQCITGILPRQAAFSMLSPSALLMMMPSVISMIPRFDSLKFVALYLRVGSRGRSPTPWRTAVSLLSNADCFNEDCVNPAASQRTMVSRVLRATPPSEPAVGEGRMNALFSLDSASIRVLSPRILPLLISLLGSMASTASLCPCFMRCMPSTSMDVLFPAPGNACYKFAHGFSCIGKTFLDDFLGNRLMVMLRTFNQSDGLAQYGDVAFQYPFHKFCRRVLSSLNLVSWYGLTVGTSATPELTLSPL